jgi:hypothetical protein
MKKIILFSLIFSLLLFFNNRGYAHEMNTIEKKLDKKEKAQPPYKASVGGIMPYTSLAFGPSFKTFFTEKVAFQTDIYIKGVLSAGKDISINKIVFAPYLSVETNMNFFYQTNMKDKESCVLFWLMGGGISLGYSWTPGGGKFGINTIMGLEYKFKKKPLTIQIDFRPGYGLLFNSNYDYVEAIFTTFKNPWSHFDWFIGGTLRYTLKTNNSDY